MHREEVFSEPHQSITLRPTLRSQFTVGAAGACLTRRQRLTSARVAMPADDRPAAPLAALLQLHGRAIAAVRHVADVVAAAGASTTQLQAIATAAYLPFEAQIARCDSFFDTPTEHAGLLC